MPIQTSLFNNKKKRRKSDFTFIDLFAGIGGTRIAFERNGGECVFSSEWDSSCQKTYQANFDEIPYGDITKIKENEIPDFDLLVSGFPCQAFSTFGKREGFRHATQGTLFHDIGIIINTFDFFDRTPLKYCGSGFWVERYGLKAKK